MRYESAHTKPAKNSPSISNLTPHDISSSNEGIDSTRVAKPL